MKLGEGQLVETYLDFGGRIVCPPELIPASGQYLHAQAIESDDPLAVSVFFSESAPNGFRAAPPLPRAWVPGARLSLRGPLGHGFAAPVSARRVALVAFDDLPARLLGLVPLVLKQDGAVALLCESAPDDLSEDVEIHPLRSLDEIIRWADYVAVDVARENLPALVSRLGNARAAQVLVRASMPCAGLAECGVCALTKNNQWLMVCRDGPVFDLSEIKNLS